MPEEKWISCKNCGHSYSKTLNRCPECGKTTPLSLKWILGSTILTGIIIISVAGFALGLSDKGNKIEATSESSVVSYSEESSKTSQGASSVASKPKNSSTASKKPNVNSKTPTEESKPDSVSSKQTTTQNNTILKQESAVLESNKVESATVSTEKTNYSTTIKISSDWVELIETITESEFNPMSEDNEYEIISYNKELDGSVNIEFTNNGYEKYKTDLYTESKNAILELRNVVPFIKQISCNNDLSVIKIAVYEYNPDNDKETLDLVAQIAYTYAYIYKSFIGDTDLAVTVEVSTFDTHETVTTYNFPIIQ